MKLDRVTITGADNSIAPWELLPLSRRFPFVEWGILMSKNSMGGNRFPSEEWLWEFRHMQRHFPVKASMHLCGSWLRDLLMGKVVEELTTFIDCFERVQLNFHAEPTRYDAKAFRGALDRLDKYRDPDHRRGHPLHLELQYIFQVDGTDGEKLLRATFHEPLTPVSAVLLFDLSHGAGVLPNAWPAPIIANLYHGYAGGLGPDNLAEQIPAIGQAAGDCHVWIDMETRVRSNDDRQFDLAKVRRCLEIAKPFVS